MTRRPRIPLGWNEKADVNQLGLSRSDNRLLNGNQPRVVPAAVKLRSRLDWTSATSPFTPVFLDYHGAMVWVAALLLSPSLSAGPEVRFPCQGKRPPRRV